MAVPFQMIWGEIARQRGGAGAGGGGVTVSTSNEGLLSGKFADITGVGWQLLTGITY